MAELTGHFGTIHSSELVRGVVAGPISVALEPGDSRYNWLNHHARDLETGTVVTLPLLINAPHRKDISSWFAEAKDAGDLLARVWESGLAGSQDVAYLERVLEEYRGYCTGRDM